MKHYTLKDSPMRQVSHEPSLKKKLIVDKGVLPGIRGMSHIVLPSGTSVEAHSHSDGHEVFYCLSGRALATVGKQEAMLEAGHTLIVEPGESHSFDVIEEAKLLYFFVSNKQNQPT